MSFQGDSIYWVEVNKVVPNPFQPRRVFDDDKLQELSESIRMYGVLQPLTVTRKEVQNEDGTFFTEYELIAGERRLRASKLAGVAQVPVIIREGEQSEQEKLELAIIENLQREDLNAVDRALAFKQLADEFNMSHTQVAKKVQRSREYVSNSIRLLGLPEYILDSLRSGEITEGHARTLLMLDNRPEEQQVIFKEMVLKKMTVREVEKIVRKIATDKIRKKGPEDFDANLLELEKKFTETLGTRVQIQKTDFGGKLTIDYFSEDDLEQILQRVKDDADERRVESEVQSIVEKMTEGTPLQTAAAAATVTTSETLTPPPQAFPEDNLGQRQPEETTAMPTIEPENVPQAPSMPVSQESEDVESPVAPAAQTHFHQSPMMVDSEVKPAAEESYTQPTPIQQAAEPVSAVHAAPAQQSLEQEVESAPSQVTDSVSPTKTEDESDLYSINSFNI